jgi:hypothetical protein
MSTATTPLKAKQILAIPVDQPEKLFTGVEELAKKEYRKLAMHWHPDRGADQAAEVLAHVNVLWDLAQKKFKDGAWIMPGRITISATDGRTFEINFQKHHKIELGDMYIGKTIIAYAIDKDNADLYDNGVRFIKNFKYPDTKMNENISRLLPKIKAEVKTIDKHFLIIEKPKNVILLKDLLAYYGGKLDPRHVAWILSRLYNLGCYLKWAKIAHNDIALDTVFIEPSNHAGYLLGGWWFTANVGEKLKAVPGSLLTHAPAALMRDKVGTTQFDMEMIRLVGRQLLGDQHGTKLKLDKDLPKPLVEWLRNPSAGDSFHDFKKWKDEILDASFGKRKFHEMKLTEADIYNA